MVKPAFLSTELYLRQGDELMGCVVTIREVERVLSNSLAAAQRLGLEGSVELLGSALQTLLDASALLDDVVMMLSVPGRKTR